MNDFIKKIYIEPFRYTCYIVITNNILESRKNKKYKLPECSYIEEPLGLHVDAGTLYSYIFIKPTSTNNIIVHETYHCIRKLLRDIGSKQEEEVVAYLLAYLFEKVLKCQQQYLTSLKAGEIQ